MNIIVHTVNDLKIGQRREDGYINLTKMAQASGKKLNDYSRLDTTKAFTDELSMDTGIPVSKLIQTLLLPSRRINSRKLKKSSS